MFTPLRLTVLLCALPGALAAQRPTPATTADPAVLRAAVYPGFGAPLRPAAGTRLATQQRWMNLPCPARGCVVAQGSAAEGPAVSAQLGDGSVRGARATLMVPHGQPHALRVSLDGREMGGFSCDGHTIRVQGAGGAPFRWAVYQGERRVDGGASTGAPVDVKQAGPGGGPMHLSVRQSDPAQLAGADEAWCKKYGCLSLALSHGDRRIVVMPVLDRSSPLALRELGVRVNGAASFALAGLEVERAAP